MKLIKIEDTNYSYKKDYLKPFGETMIGDEGISFVLAQSFDTENERSGNIYFTLSQAKDLFKQLEKLVVNVKEKEPKEPEKSKEPKTNNVPAASKEPKSNDKTNNLNGNSKTKK